MTVIITLTTAGEDTGPFDLFSNIGDYATAFEIDVPKQDLLDGYPSNLVPDGTTIIRVQSVNSLCNNYIDLSTGITTTTTTTGPTSYTHILTEGETEFIAACESGSSLYVYSPEEFLYGGGLIYEDQQLQTLFDGNDLYYRSYAESFVFVINNSGQASGYIAPCPS